MRRRSPSQPESGPYLPLFWRLFVPNASVLLSACVILVVEPADGRVVALVGGLAVLLAVNLVLMRRAFAPLVRLAALMDRIDPLQPGQRIPPFGPASEVTVLTAAFNDMLDRLERERRESGRRELLAQEAERRHLAAELHDGIGQGLTGLKLQLELLAREVEAPQREELRAAAESAGETLEEVRRLARRLRPEALDQLGLLPALTSLCDRLGVQAGLRIERELPATPPALSPDAELVLYRVAQEGLTNAVRHAGASRARLALAERDGEVVLRVADDGRGLGTGPEEGAGVRGMRERALLVGGRLELGRSSLGGAEVTLVLPATPAPA